MRSIKRLLPSLKNSLSFHKRGMPKKSSKTGQIEKQNDEKCNSNWRKWLRNKSQQKSQLKLLGWEVKTNNILSMKRNRKLLKISFARRRLPELVIWVQQEDPTRTRAARIKELTAQAIREIKERLSILANTTGKFPLEEWVQGNSNT